MPSGAANINSVNMEINDHHHEQLERQISDPITQKRYEIFNKLIINNHNSVCRWNIEDENLLNDYFGDIMQSIDHLVCIDRDTFVNAIAGLPHKLIQSLRKDLFDEIINRNEIDQAEWEPIRRNKPEAGAKDIYLIMQYLVSTATLSFQQFLEIFKKTKNNSLQDNNNDNLMEILIEQGKLIERLNSSINNLTVTITELKKENSNQTFTINNLSSMVNKLILHQSKENTQKQNTNTNDLIGCNQLDQFPHLPQSVFRPTDQLNTAPGTNNNTSNQTATAYSSMINNNNLKRSRIDNINNQHNKTPRTTNSLQHNNRNSNNSRNNTNTNNTSKQYTKQTMKNFDSENPDLPNTELTTEKEYTLVGDKRKHRNKHRQYGTGSRPDDPQIAIKRCLIFLGRIAKKETLDSVKNLINDRGIECFDLESIPLNHNHFNSYKFYININLLDKIKDKSLWPLGCIIDRTFPPRKQATNITMQQQNPTTANSMPQSATGSVQTTE